MISNANIFTKNKTTIPGKKLQVSRSAIRRYKLY